MNTRWFKLMVIFVLSSDCMAFSADNNFEWFDNFSYAVSLKVKEFYPKSKCAIDQRKLLCEWNTRAIPERSVKPVYFERDMIPGRTGFIIEISPQIGSLKNSQILVPQTLQRKYYSLKLLGTESEECKCYVWALIYYGQQTNKEFIDAIQAEIHSAFKSGS